MNKCKDCINYEDRATYKGTGYCIIWQDYVKDVDDCEDYEEVRGGGIEMWELIIELVEDTEIYFCYTFAAYETLMAFLASNERHNAEHCTYTITKVGEVE